VGIPALPRYQAEQLAKATAAHIETCSLELKIGEHKARQMALLAGPGGERFCDRIKSAERDLGPLC
jgi:hypothetical protein